MPELHEKQVEAVAKIKANPDSNFLISGDYGAGKTHFFWALYRRACQQHRSVYANTAEGLIGEFQTAIELSKRGERYFPRITPEELKQSKQKYSIFLDDIDKIKVTEYAAGKIFEITNACHDYHHQLVVTTNLTLTQLVIYFSDADRDRRSGEEGFQRFGGSIVRRLLKNAEEIELF